MKKSYLTVGFLKAKINLRLIALIITGLLFQLNSYSQATIPATDGSPATQGYAPFGAISVPCQNCTPPSWIDSDGGLSGGGTPDVSNATQGGETMSDEGQYGGGASWAIGTLPLPPNGHTSWLSLRDVGTASSAEESVSTTMTGLVPGQTYELVIYTLTATSNNDGGLSGAQSYAVNPIDEYGYIVAGLPRVDVNYTTFLTNVWNTEKVRFVATATSETVEFFPGDDNVNIGLGSTSNTRESFQTIQISVTLNAVLLVPDTDGDSVLDDADVDSDNDGIFDDNEYLGIIDPLTSLPITPPYTDADGDGSPAYLDPNDADPADSNYDVTIINPLYDTDGDGIANHQDLDSDGDGIPDNIEAQATVGYVAPSGIIDPVTGADLQYLVGLTPVNTDVASEPVGSQLPDFLDLDSDNEGGNDTTEVGITLSGVIGDNGLDTNSETSDDYSDVNGNFNNPQADFPDSDNDIPFGGDLDYRDSSFAVDTDGDNVPDIGDLDDDNDGILDTDESGGLDATGDDDNDGVPNYQDSDFCALNTAGVCNDLDKDGDGIINQYDLDSDNDGIADIIELGGADTDGDGRLDGFTDNDGDGIHDPIDNVDNGSGVGEVTSGIPLVIINTDVASEPVGSQLPDFLDLDSDGDGIPDNIEAQDTGSYIAPSGGDNDLDGLDDAYDSDDSGTPITTPVNTDIASEATGSQLPDYIDTDSDNDGVLDATENGSTVNIALGTDTDGDGIDDAWDNNNVTGNTGAPANVNNGINPPNAANLGDEDSDGILDYRDILDADGDGVADNADLDDDNDGILDADENGGVDATGDADGDGIPNYQDADFCTLNSAGVCDNLDTDGDGVINQYDVDSDNDGITDVIEVGGADADGNGQLDGFLDDDGDGLHDLIDNVDNGSGASEVTTGTPLVIINTDAATGDTLPNYLDLDSDGDGISDIVEANNGDVIIDADGDGRVDYATSGDPSTLLDNNNNGLANAIDPAEGGTPLAVPNTDIVTEPVSVQLSDYIDIDSDGDGIVDNIEGQTTVAYIAPAGTDIDNDGIDDNYDGDDGNTFGIIDPLGPGGSIAPTNTDGTDEPDYLDSNSDNDVANDSLEGWDTDNDGTAEIVPAGGDADVDGLDNAYDTDDLNLDPTNGGTLPTNFPNLDPTPLDTDRDWREALDIDNDDDGVDDPTDLDDDNDGVSDIDESSGNNPDGDLDGDGIPNWQDTTDNTGLSDPTYTDDDGNGIPDVYDQDGDGVPNHKDLDSDNDGIYDIVESGFINPAATVNIVDVDNNGRIDAANPSTVDANGQFPASVGLIPLNSDTDTLIDLLDLNSDSADPASEDCKDAVEARFTTIPTDADLDDNGFLGTGTFGAGLAVDADGKVTSAGFDSYLLVPANVNANAVLDFQEPNVTTALNSPIPALPAILAGDNLSIAVSSTANTFQWQVSTDGGTSWNNITDGGTSPTYSGATTDNLTITNVPASFAGHQYQVLLSTSNYACDTQIPSNAVTVVLLGDADGDTIADIIDLDDDNDGIPDTIESSGNNPDGDSDGDGILNWQDTTDDTGLNDPTYEDLDGNGIPDIYDTDNDGVPNHIDLDSDNDGIYDLVESGQLVNANVLDNVVDGRIDGANDPANVGANGLFNFLETDGLDSGSLIIETRNSDEPIDTIPDALELDADNDGCFDIVEAGFASEDSDGDNMLGSNVSLVVNPATGVVDLPASGLTLGYTEPIDNNNGNGTGNGTFDFQEAGVYVTPIATDPASQVIVINANVNFNTDNQTVTFLWEENDGSGWSPVSNGGSNPVYSGATTNSLTLTQVPGSYDGYQYRVTLSSPALACSGTETSAPATLTVGRDEDNDGIIDRFDLDTDNDGIPNVNEYPGVTFSDPYDDADGDGVINLLDDDSINPSIGDDNNAIEPQYDFDNDGIPNHLDIDSDDDGVNDVIEAGHGFVDSNGNGRIDDADSSTVGTNGVYDTVETIVDASPTTDINYTLLNSDSDTALDFLDTDDDGDGVPTESESPDPNGDGLLDDAQDTDQDRVLDYLDIDDDNDGILTATEGTGNTADSDNIPNYLDLDSDGDGIPDNVEGQLTIGYIPPSNTVNAQGLDNAYVTTNGIQAQNVNTDQPNAVGSDLTPDYLDDDSDGDSVLDSVEGHDFDFNGIPDVNPSGDNDNDGLDNSYDATPNSGYATPNGNIVSPQSDLPDTDTDVTDTDGNVNYRDIDDDNDSIHTIYEVPLGNSDTDTRPNYLDADDDGDNVATIDENPTPDGNGNPANAQNTDGEDLPDYLDTDDDNDDVLTIDEVANAGDNPMDFNSDADGRANYLDIDDDNDGILTKKEVEDGNNDDTDSFPNYLDQDSDGDGIPDNVEAQPTASATFKLPLLIDNDNDGLDDAYDDNVPTTDVSGYKDSKGLSPEDTLNDGSLDYINEDSDADGVPDFVEGFDFSDSASLITAPNGEPDVDFSGNDDDKDGLDDNFDGDLTGFGDPNGKFVETSTEEDLPNRDLFIYTFYNNSSSPLSPITPDNEVDFRDTDDDGDGELTNSEEEDRNLDGNPRNDNCNGGSNNVTPNYLDPIDCNRIPTGFSPNGDENNDLFIIPGVDKYPNFTVKIYDRWGNIVFDYANNGKPRDQITWWDGYSTGSMILAKGQKVPVGTYYYIIEFNGNDGKAPVTGWVYVNY